MKNKINISKLNWLLDQNYGYFKCKSQNYEKNN